MIDSPDTLRRRAGELRSLARSIDAVSFGSLLPLADRDTFVGPTAEVCRDELAASAAALRRSVDDLRAGAGALDRRADEREAAARAALAAPIVGPVAPPR